MHLSINFSLIFPRTVFEMFTPTLLILLLLLLLLPPRPRVHGMTQDLVFGAQLLSDLGIAPNSVLWSDTDKWRTQTNVLFFYLRVEQIVW